MIKNYLRFNLRFNKALNWIILYKKSLFLCVCSNYELIMIRAFFIEL